MPIEFESLEFAFRYVGEFVEDLNFEYFNRRTENILANCNNLKKLCFRNHMFESENIYAIQNRIESLQYLQQLEFVDCQGITNNWRPANGISNVVKLRIDTGAADVTGHFIDYFTNLTSLTINVENCCWKFADLVEMFENSSHSMTHLKVTDKSNRIAPELLARLITEKLYKLEILELELCFTEATMCLIRLPQLKTVDLSCGNVNTILRTLSDNGIIEELKLDGHYDGSGRNASLLFQKLRKISWAAASYHNLFKTLTEWQMPVIQTVIFYNIQSHEIDGLVKFIASKNTFKSIKLTLAKATKLPISFWCQVIDILKDSSTPRPFVSFVIYPFNVEAEVVSKITF